MKNIKKWIAVILAVLMCLSLTGCAGNRAAAGGAKLEVSEKAEDGSYVTGEVKDPAQYEQNVQGLCKFLEDCGVAAGDRVQMEYGVIGAKNGYKYVYAYGDSSVQLEVYEYDTEALSDTAKAILDAVKTEGCFHLLDNTVPAQLSADCRYMLIYTDERAAKNDANKAHKEHVVKCFETFTAYTAE